MSEEVTEIAEEIFKLVGPIENILSVKSCMNNLKLRLKDKRKVNIGILKKIKGVSGIVETREQLQIIIIHDNSKGIIFEFNKIFEKKSKLLFENEDVKIYLKIKQLFK